MHVLVHSRYTKDGIIGVESSGLPKAIFLKPVTQHDVGAKRIIHGVERIVCRDWK